jgi:heat shock protein HslJ
VLAALPGVPAWTGPAATLTFEAGRARGSDGCNRYSGSYRVSGSAIELPGRAAATMMACPPDVMQRAQAFTDALARARSYRAGGGELQLLGADGAPVAHLRAQSQALAGTSWRVVAINDGKGAVRSLHVGTALTLNFLQDERVAGSAGCNRYSAGYRAERGRLTFSQAAATRMLCSGEGVMEQERAFLAALASVTSARFDGDALELRGADGALLIDATRGTAE